MARGLWVAMQDNLAESAVPTALLQAEMFPWMSESVSGMQGGA